MEYFNTETLMKEFKKSLDNGQISIDNGDYFKHIHTATIRTAMDLVDGGVCQKGDGDNPDSEALAFLKQLSDYVQDNYDANEGQAYETVLGYVNERVEHGDRTKKLLDQRNAALDGVLENVFPSAE